MPLATSSVEEFVCLIEQSQLLRTTVLEKVKAQIPTLGAGNDDAERVAKSLVKSQILSTYQAMRLLSGKSDGFYLGKYRLLDVLGQGGMGMVYLAEQMTMGRLVALKVIGRISKNMNDAMERFKREARAVAQLSHQNIIQAYDFDEIDGTPFISMEFVEGIDLDRQVAKFGPIDWKQACDYALQAASGLEAARLAKFVHRDIKPGNLLVDTNGIVKILDLGLVVTKQQTRNDSLTSAQDQVGTVDYMAPEQALNSHRVDIRADLYSLGGVMHFLLTGKIPFEGTSSAEKLLKHQSASPTPLRQIRSDLPEEVEAIVLKLLAKKPDDRFQTPEELIASLKPLAQRRTPPYDLSAVKHPRSTFVPLLGRGPDANEIISRSNLSGILTPTQLASNSATATGVVSTKSTGVSERPHSSVDSPTPPNAITRRMPSQVATRELAIEQRKTAVSTNHSNRSSAKSAILIVPNKAEQEHEDEFRDLPTLPTAPRRRIRKSDGKSSKSNSASDSNFLMMFGGLLSIVVVIVAAIAFMSGRSSNQEALAKDSTSSGSTTSGDTLVAKSRFIRIPLDSIANVVSTKGMFNEEANDTERLVLSDWSSREVQGIPFALIDPQVTSNPNVVMLKGELGHKAPKMPASVTVPTNCSAKAIHLLSGVGGYCYPSQPKGSVSMIVRLAYADGSFEEHPLVNGTHFADYIKRVDVPGSQFAFSLREQQMRLLTVVPRKEVRITSIELKKGSDKTAPLIMGITVEELNPSTSLAEFKTGQPSFDRWKTYSEALRRDPDMVAYYTFNAPKDGKDVLHSEATSPKFGNMNGKIHNGARWVPGRFSQKTALKFEGKNSGHYVSLGDGDSANCNFTSSFTIATWFKTDKFDAAHQVLIAKGDSSWRLQRDNERPNYNSR